jgi:hypothetical protein
VLLLWLHVVALPAFAVARGYPLGHGALDTFPILACALGASTGRLSDRTRSAIGALGLVTCSAILTHLWGGVTEAHFHFFVVVALLSLYEDWLPWGVSIAYVLVHHGRAGRRQRNSSAERRPRRSRRARSRRTPPRARARSSAERPRTRPSQRPAPPIPAASSTVW